MSYYLISPYARQEEEYKLQNEQLIMELRNMLCAKFGSIEEYMHLIQATDNDLALEILNDIVNEEKVHAGQLLRVIKEISEADAKFFEEGTKRVEEVLNMLKTRCLGN